MASRRSRRRAGAGGVSRVVRRPGVRGRGAPRALAWMVSVPVPRALETRPGPWSGGAAGSRAGRREAPSDYGRAFYAFAAGPLRAIGRDAVLLVLGDGRSNDLDPLPWAFEEIAARARRVIWLVPEPRALWGTGDSALGRYLPFCDVAVETADLDGLAHGVRELPSDGRSP